LTQLAIHTPEPLVMFRPARWVFPRTGIDLTADASGRQIDQAVKELTTDELEGLLWQRQRQGLA
jgi:hypothetical protein